MPALMIVFALLGIVVLVLACTMIAYWKGRKDGYELAKEVHGKKWSREDMEL